MADDPRERIEAFVSLPEFSFAELSLGNIPDDADGTTERFVTNEDGDLYLTGNRLAVFGLERYLDGVGRLLPVAFEQRHDRLLARVDVLLADQQRDVLAEQPSRL